LKWRDGFSPQKGVEHVLDHIGDSLSFVASGIAYWLHDRRIRSYPSGHRHHRVSGPTYSATKNIVASRYPRAKPVALFKIQALLDALRSSPHSPTAKAEELCPLGYEIYEPAEEGDQFL
jgi:hypothetical protein